MDILNRGTVVNRVGLLKAQKEHVEGTKITIRELEEATGIQRTTISRILRNEVVRYTVDMLAALCEYFDCDMGELMEYRPPADEEPSLQSADDIRENVMRAVEGG